MSDPSQPFAPDEGLAAGQKAGGGRFTLVRFLGRGGMGVVWLAQDERLNEPAALKFLPATVRNDATALDGLRKETQSSRRLTHPNIIRIHDLFEGPDEAPFIAMEYVEGQTLSQLKAAQVQRYFPWEYLRPLALQLCAALDYAHAENVIHRDLKPANVMLDARGRLKLADFGVSVAVAESVNRISGARSISGTPGYMSPQQLDGESARVADDIYALGATLYELLTSKPPFYTGDIPHQTRMFDPVPLEERMAEFGIVNPVPPEVSAAILACVAHDPAKRPASARALAEMMGLELPALSESQRASTPGTWAAARARKRKLTLGAIALVVVALAGMFWLGQQKAKPPVAAGPPPPKEPETGAGWVKLFTGPLRLWTEEPDRWRITTDGTILGIGPKSSMLRSTGAFTNFIFSVDFKLAPAASGVVTLRAQRQKKGPPKGYGVIVGNTYKGFRRTGSVLNYKDILESPVKDEEWFRMQMVVIGSRLTVIVNDQILVDFPDANPPTDSGDIYFFRYGGPVLMIRNPQAKELSLDPALATKEAVRAVKGLK